MKCCTYEPNDKTGTISVVAYAACQKCTIFPCFQGGGGRKRASSHLSNLSKFWKKEKKEELLNMIFENSFAKGYYKIRNFASVVGFSIFLVTSS